jgi:hypothetical protein
LVGSSTLSDILVPEIGFTQQKKRKFSSPAEKVQHIEGEEKKNRSSLAVTLTKNSR